MTQEQFERLNPIICTTYGNMGYNTHEAMLIQGAFLATRTFILDTLNSDEAEFVKLRYGVENQSPKKLQDIAEILNVSFNKTKQIELKVVRKLRHPSRIKLLKEYTDDTIDMSLIDNFNGIKSL